MVVEATVRDKVLFSELGKELSIWNPYLTWSVLVAYLSFTKLFGPIMMKNRKPFDLQMLMILYNGLMVVANAFLSVRFTKLLLEFWPYRCDVTLCPVVQEPGRLVQVASMLFYVKFVELFDTILFILRKKFNQVSFLHVLHHSIVFILVWICCKFSLIMRFHMLVACCINCNVHVVMYLYYGLSAMGPNVRKYLWWKKYLTKVQIIQFFVVLLYMTFSGMTGCDKFSIFDKFLYIFVLIIAVLFFNFYIKEYTRKK